MLLSVWKWEDSRRGRRDRREDCSDPACRDFSFRTKPQSHEKAGSRPQGRFSFHRCDLAQREGKKPLRGQHDIFVPLWLCAKQIGPAFAAWSQRLCDLCDLCANLIKCRVRPRSEEHTSELQSLMRISYAVFCLTKK